MQNELKRHNKVKIMLLLIGTIAIKQILWLGLTKIKHIYFFVMRKREAGYWNSLDKCACVSPCVGVSMYVCVFCVYEGYIFVVFE